MKYFIKQGRPLTWKICKSGKSQGEMFYEKVREVNKNTVFDRIGARGAYVNLFSTTSAKRSSSGR